MMEPLRGGDIRQQNEKIILNIIHKSEGISQSEVVQLTGLKPPTVFRIFSSLEEDGLIEVYDKKVEEIEKKGRRPVYYRVKADARYVVGIDFWVGSASVVMIDFGGNPVYENVKEFPQPLHADEVVPELNSLVEEAIAKSGVEKKRLLGIGIGAPGRVDIEKGVVVYYGRIGGMQNFSIKAPLEREFGLPVYVHNNAAVVALSEYRYGVAKEQESLLTVLIRTGVGGSFIDKGKIFVTNNRTTLEIGHMLIEMDGRHCSCGRDGCLEPYVSEDALLSEISQLNREAAQDDTNREAAQDDTSQLSPFVENPNMENLDDLIGVDLPHVGELLNKKADILSEGIRSLFELFGPDSFLIVTRSQRLSDFLAAKVRSRLDCDPGECAVLSCKYDPILAGIGASDLVLDHFFS